MDYDGHIVENIKIDNAFTYKTGIATPPKATINRPLFPQH